MTDHPFQPFNDAVKDIKPEPKKSQGPANPYPPRDKDNVGYAPKPPTFGIAGTSRQGPAGTIGNRGSAEEKSMPKPEIDITKGDPDKDLWVHGKITSMEGYSFALKNHELPSVHGINNGTISKLEIRENGKQVAAYDRGWDVKPETPKAREALDKIMDHFDGHDKEFKPIAPPTQDKDQSRDR